MVLKTQLCRFSGLRIYPGKGILFIRVDSQQFLFLNKKCKNLYHNRLRPAKLAWTVTYRKQHKKDQVCSSFTSTCAWSQPPSVAPNHSVTE
jgi:large subunit ribosomal protein L24e